MENKQPTILIGADGIEYVIRGGKLHEKCQHRTRTDKSSGKERWEVCYDCGKTLIYNKDTTESSNPIEMFRSIHGRDPKGMEISMLL